MAPSSCASRRAPMRHPVFAKSHERTTRAAHATKNVFRSIVSLARARALRCGAAWMENRVRDQTVPRPAEANIATSRLHVTRAFRPAPSSLRNRLWARAGRRSKVTFATSIVGIRRARTTRVRLPNSASARQRPFAVSPKSKWENCVMKTPRKMIGYRVAFRLVPADRCVTEILTALRGYSATSIRMAKSSADRRLSDAN